MKILDYALSKKIDEITISKGIKEETLMEQAAFALTDVILSFKPKKVLYVLGTGNNGGDGLASARMLINKGYSPEVYINGNINNVSEGFKKQLEIAKKYNLIINDSFVDINIEQFDIVIDGLIGIGIKGEINKKTSAIIDKINKFSKFTISIDIPTGISADNGKIMGNAIKADLTVAFGYLKIGHLINEGRDFSGDIKVVELSFDKSLDNKIKKELVTHNSVKKLIPSRNKIHHKYNAGYLLILAGSKDFTGAAILSAFSAQKSGCGLVKLITPNYDSSILTLEPSVIYNYYNKDYFQKNDIELIKQDIEKCDAMLIGPGLTKKSYEFVKNILVNYKNVKNIVLDAESIEIIKEFSQFNYNVTITPHRGEFVKYVDNDYNITNLENISKNKKINILFKDKTTLIVSNDEVFFNIEGDSSLSKGGTGDILSGLIGSFLAQGSTHQEANILASYIIYSTAKDLRNEYTEFFITPKLITDNIYKIFKKLQE